MIRCSLALTAESVVVDGATNLASVFNIIEEVQSAVYPIAIPKLMILFVLERDTDDPEQPGGFRLIANLAGRELVSVPVEPNFQGRARLRLVTGFGGFVVPGPGTLVFSLRSADTEVGQWRVAVLQQGHAQLLPLEAQTTTANEPVRAPAVHVEANG